MAGDFLFWSKGLAKKREVIKIAAAVEQDRRWVASALMEFWEWVDSESANGFIPGVTGPAALQLVFADVPASFWAAVEEAGWIKFRNGGLAITNFDRWLCHSAKKRLADAKRKRAEYATRKRDGPSVDSSVFSPQQNGDSLLSSSLSSALEGDGGLGEGETERRKSACWLAREWCTHLKRRRHGLVADKAEDVSPELEELLRAGFTVEELHAEIARKERLKSEYLWEMRDRLMKKRANGSDDFVEKLNKARAEVAAREAGKNGR